ncbi:MAG TPA: TetR/AcrR family transcriptional regulator [Luteibaculaceae bacterium]|nr:TetR/AcrR family transcriptional regulator [Luteibaculaceae bacterium]
MEVLQINVHPKIYLKDPRSSELGRGILLEGLHLMHQLGLEEFTFRKLAMHIHTTESSIYRYFETKHKLLLFYESWYWSWVAYRIQFEISNIEQVDERIRRLIGVLAYQPEPHERYGLFAVKTVKDVVVSESVKSYFVKSVDDNQRAGYFGPYLRVVERLSELIEELEPAYPFANALATTVVEGVLHQQHFAGHIPALTNFNPASDALTEFFNQLVLSAKGYGKNL